MTRLFKDAGRFGPVRRRRSRVATCISVVALLGSALVSVAPTLASDAMASEPPAQIQKVSTAAPNELGAIDRALAPTQNDPLYVVLADLESEKVDGVASEFVGIFAGTKVSADGTTLDVLYNETGRADRVAELLRRIGAVDGRSQVNVVATPVDFDPDARSALATRISEGGSEWTTQLGVSSISSVEMDSMTGVITVMTPDPAPARSQVTIESTPVNIVSSKISVTAQNRATDFAP